MSAERDRLQEGPHGRAPWRRWGPYLSERAWGTVREDYSANGEGWDSFPHDHARARAYRWHEDSLAGVCDDGRYWEITADYAKATPEDVLIRVSVRNHGPEAAVIDVLPTLWYRNTWSWDLDGAKPQLRLEDGAIAGTSTLSGDGSPE